MTRKPGDLPGHAHPTFSRGAEKHGPYPVWWHLKKSRLQTGCKVRDMPFPTTDISDRRQISFVMRQCLPLWRGGIVMSISKGRLGQFFLLSTVLVPSCAFAQSATLDEIIITANRTPLSEQQVGSSVSVVTRDELRAAGAITIGDYISRLPGVVFQQDGGRAGTSNLRIRGLSSIYTVVMIDGIEVSDPTQTQARPDFASIAVTDVQRIEVVRGPQSSLYGGDAVAGVINIITNRPERDGLSHAYRVETGSYRTRLGAYSLMGRNERGNFAINASGFDTGGFSAVDENDGFHEADGYTLGTLSASGEYELEPGFALFGALRYSNAYAAFDDYFGGVGSDANNSTITEAYGARIGGRWLMGELKNTVSAQYYSTKRDTTFDGNFGISKAWFDGERYKIDYLGEYQFNERFGLVFGADAEETTARTSSQRVEEQAGIYGGFVQGIVSPADNLTLSATLRGDQHSGFGGYLTYRLSAAYVLAQTGTTFRSSYGSGFRAPSLNELYGPFGSNPDLVPEESRGFDIGLEQGLWDGRIVLGASWFHNHVDNLIQYQFGRPGPDYFQLDGTTTTKGVELSLEARPMEQVSLFANYTYTAAEAENGNRLSRVPAHFASLGLTVTPVDRLSLSVLAKMSSDAVGNNLAPLEDYVVIDANASYQLPHGAEIYLRGENIFNEQYQTARGYGEADRAIYIGVKGKL